MNVFIGVNKGPSRSVPHTAADVSLLLVFRLHRECRWCSESQEEELRGVTGGRTDAALLGKAGQRPGEARQQPSTRSGQADSDSSVILSYWTLILL